MSERSFYRPEARSTIAAAVKELESKTDAEVEVAVRRVSGRYRDVDYAAGMALVLAATAVHALTVRPGWVHALPLDVVLAFVVGSVGCAHFWNLRRLLVPRRRQAARVREAALATFTELGIARTHRRRGILVYVSLFERKVEVVPDIGIDAVALGGTWPAALAELQAAMVRHHDLERFGAGLRALGPVLGSAYPRTAESVNELPDEPDTR